MNYPIGTTGMLMLFIALFFVVMWVFATVMANVRFVRLTVGEVLVMVMFSSSFSMFLGLLIGQQFILALMVFLFLVFISAVMIIKRLNRWFVTRADRIGTREAMASERKEMERRGLIK